MNAPLLEQHHAAIGSRAELREFAAEAFASAANVADIGERFAYDGDDTGLHYAARKLAAYTRAILGTVADLQNHPEAPDAEH